MLFLANQESSMMATTAVLGIRGGKRLLGSSSCYSEVNEKLSCSSDLGFTFVPTKNVITAKGSSNYGHSFISNRGTHSIRALKEHVNTISDPPSKDQQVQKFDHLEEEGSLQELSVDALLSLQRSLLEKQWNLSHERTMPTATPLEKSSKKVYVTGSTKSARRRRLDAQRKTANPRSTGKQFSADEQLRSIISPELLQNRSKGYLNGVISEALLTHSEVVALSKKIKIGMHVEEQRSRLKERLGSEPSEAQLAASLRISPQELRIKQVECTLAREKLAMSNVRLVMSIAQKYYNMGAEMDDLIQGGLIGLLRGIEKYDSSRGCKISTYVYWWIRQGVSRALIENSRLLRMPTHMHERLGAIRSAKAKLKTKGITPTIEKVAATLGMSSKKVRNAVETKTKMYSLDWDAFPSLGGDSGDTFHNYVPDKRPESNLWLRAEKQAVKDEVNKLLAMTLSEREQVIIRMYYGLDHESLTWEDISKRIGLSRERVRQIGLVAFEKLKHAAKNKELEALLLKH